MTASMFADLATPAEDEMPPSNLESARRDIDSVADSVGRHDPTGETLESERQRVLREIHEQIGGRQVGYYLMSFAPCWLLEESFEKEFGDNWDDKIELIPLDQVPSDVNVIGSHSVYRVKTDEEGKLALKGRIVPHGNHDNESNGVRRDSASAELTIIRLLLALATTLGFRVWTAHLKGSYMQSGLIDRKVYVRPPRGWKGPRGVLWRLLRLLYGIVEAGRLWLCCIENWMMQVYGLLRLKSVDQLVMNRDANGRIELFVAKVTDDFIIAGTEEAMESFTQALGKVCTLKTVNKGQRQIFLGMLVTQDASGSITVSMDHYLERIKELQISHASAQHPYAAADDRQISEYRSIAGSLFYLGQAVLPHACYVASKMQQRINRLSMSHLLEANDMLRDLRRYGATFKHFSPTSIRSVRLASFSDASHGGLDEVHGQTSYISRLLIEQDAGGPPLYNAVAWTSSKHTKVSYSSYSAEILTATDSDGRGFSLKCEILEIFPLHPVQHELLVDSKSLFETITTLHSAGDYRLRRTVARMPDSFESQDLNVLRWIPGAENYADALKKRNVRINDCLATVLRTGLWELDFTRGAKINSAEWS